MLLDFPFSSLLRNMFEPVVYSKGRPLRNYWKLLETTQYLPEEKLLTDQWYKLQSLLQFVWENNSFYRKRFEDASLTPDMILSLEDMRKIPILTKDEIRENAPRIMCTGFEMKSLQQFKTGGSTGKSLVIYATEECSYLRNACTRRHNQWTGWNFGEPIAAVWGNPHLPRSVKDKLRHWFLTPYIYLDTMSVSEGSVRTFATEWEKNRPTLLFGHAHSLYVLAQYVRDLSILNIKPRGILSTSMMLMPHERKVIEDVFTVKVTDLYGCEEVSLIASECEQHEGMHLNIEHLFIEFINENGLPSVPGEPGKIVVTDLLNRAMPLIRYQIEDVGVPTDRKCSCGRGLPLMESVSGRVADFLVKSDGTRVAGVSLIENTLTSIPGIDQMQIIQESINVLNINLVVGKEFSNEQENYLREYFFSIFGKNIIVNVNYVLNIEQERNGKYRFSICKVDLDLLKLK